MFVVCGGFSSLQCLLPPLFEFHSFFLSPFAPLFALLLSFLSLCFISVSLPIPFLFSPPSLHTAFLSLYFISFSLPNPSFFLSLFPFILSSFPLLYFTLSSYLRLSLSLPSLFTILSFPPFHFTLFHSPPIFPLLSFIQFFFSLVLKFHPFSLSSSLLLPLTYPSFPLFEVLFPFPFFPFFHSSPCTSDGQDR